MSLTSHKSLKEPMKATLYPLSSGATTESASLLALMIIFLEFGACKASSKDSSDLKTHSYVLVGTKVTRWWLQAEMRPTCSFGTLTQFKKTPFIPLTSKVKSWILLGRTIVSWLQPVVITYFYGL